MVETDGTLKTGKHGWRISVRTLEKVQLVSVTGERVAKTFCLKAYCYIY